MRMEEQLPLVPPVVRVLGCVAYAETFEQMRALTELRGADAPDEIWVLEHPPVFTLGQAGLPSHLLQASSIPLVQTDRGGQITYHGPGQLVVYVLLDLKRRGMMIKEWVRRIEEALILTLAEFGLVTERHEGAPGIYIADVEGQAHVGAKIAALGLKVRRGCTYHGLSLNVAMDLMPFSQINPCGYAGLETVDMRLMGVTSIEGVVPKVCVSDVQGCAVSVCESRVAELLVKFLVAQWLRV